MPSLLPGLAPSHVLAFAVRPALALLAQADPSLDTPAAEQLVMGTAAQESGFTYLGQLEGPHFAPTGPAHGIFQMESPTERDILTRIFQLHPKIYSVLKLIAFPTITPTTLSLPPQLTYDLLYSSALCRLKYFLISSPIPPANDLTAQSLYYKQWYNTPLGSALPSEYVINFHRYLIPAVYPASLFYPPSSTEPITP